MLLRRPDSTTSTICCLLPVVRPEGLGSRTNNKQLTTHPLFLTLTTTLFDAGVLLPFATESMGTSTLASGK